ncbi:MAG: ABC transporter ATP-binding protein [Phototrophicaceae bacterium]
MTSAIQLDKLSKMYKHNKQEVYAVNQLSLDVEPHQVYGFLGPNGAGKTTTIRMLLNLIYPSSGQAYLFGKSITNASDILKNRVGALVEDATFYPFMTGYDNLRTLAYTTGNIDAKRIDWVLNVVGMSAFANRKTKTYSTGMKQRLGVAGALLHNPDLIILDEPTSGLDPKGIQDMRDLIQNLAKNEGKTVFLSSHLLHEIEQTCDRVAIIQRGALVSEGTISELLGHRSIVRIVASPLATAQTILSEQFDVQLVNDALEIILPYGEIPHIIALLAAQQLEIYEVSHKRQTLEDLFLEVTHD